MLEGLSSSKAYIDISTVDEGCSKKIGEAVRGTGARFLEVSAIMQLRLFLAPLFCCEFAGLNCIPVNLMVTTTTTTMMMMIYSGSLWPWSHAALHPLKHICNVPLLACLQAPVSGSKQPAIAGQLIFLCAGDQVRGKAVVGFSSSQAILTLLPVRMHRPGSFHLHASWVFVMVTTPLSLKHYPLQGLFQEALPALDVMGKKSIYLG